VTLATPSLPQTLYSTSAVRELDRIAIQERNVAGLELMERAGQSAFDLMCERWPQAKRVVVLCGMGNNGGDGYILARLAKEAQLDVCIMQLGDKSNLKGDALAAATKCHALDLQSEPYQPNLIEKADVVVDALLGTGLDREVDGDWRIAIEDINRMSEAILSLDIPSGLNADTGAVMGVAVKADACITFIGMKQGLMTAEGPALW